MPLLELGFLYGEDVRVKCAEDIVEAFLGNGTQAIDVPRHELHAINPSNLRCLEHLARDMMSRLIREKEARIHETII